MPRLLLVALLLLLSVPAAAQGDADAETQTYVVFTTQVLVDVDEEGPVSPVLLRLAEDPNLARLTTNPMFDRGTERLRAEFVFPSLEAFAAWQADASVRSFFAELGAGDPERVQSSTRILRYPLVRLLQEDEEH